MPRRTRLLGASIAVLRVTGGSLVVLFGLWLTASALFRCANIDCTEELSVAGMVGNAILGLLVVAIGILVIWWPWERRRRERPPKY